MRKSFDIFDTLITRDVYKPTDIFIFLGKKLRDKKIIEITPFEFMKKRIEAEKFARINSNFEEITLDEIYLVLSNLVSFNLEDINEVKFLEEEIEFNFSSPIEENRRLTSYESILISDTYFKKEFLASLLKKNNISYRDIFVSSEFRKTKHHGSLYDEVIKAYNDLIHSGNDLYSDYMIPKAKNIPAIHYSNSSPSRYEKLIYENSHIPFDIKTLIAGCMKSTRLSRHYEYEHLQAIHELSSNVIAPFLFLYTYWVIKQAQIIGLDKLFFIARDGQILYEIAKLTKKRFNLNIEISYLYGSRKAWHLPATTQIDEEALDWILDPTFFLSINDICKRVDINYEDIKSEIKTSVQPDKNLTYDEREEIKKLFFSNLRIKNLILKKAREKRELVIEYLKKEGFEKNKNIGIVDVGWRGRQQVSLSKLLQLGNIYPVNGLYGFYIALTKSVSPYNKDTFITFFDKNKYSDILYYPGLYESFVASTHGSCIGYNKQNGEIVPILREEKNKDILDWGLEVQHLAIKIFADKISKYIHEFNIHIDNEQKISYLLLAEFLQFPDKKYSKVYKKLRVYEDQEELRYTHLCVNLSVNQIFKIIFLRDRSINHNIWIEGSISASVNNYFDKIFLKLLKIRKNIKKLIRKLKK